MNVPFSHVTSCTIGGENFDTLFITTAYEPLPADKVKQEPFAGYLVEIPIDQKGVENYEFETNREKMRI